MTRLTRLDIRPVPDIADDIAAAVVLPVRRVLRRRSLLRMGLLIVGLAQLAVGVPALTGRSIGMAMAAHAAHETAAWNLALAAAFVAVAAVPRRAAGLIPLLGTFLVVLGALSVHDYADGAVTADRLATHVAALAGLILLIALDRAERALPPGRRHEVRGPASGDGDAGGLRTVA